MRTATRRAGAIVTTIVLLLSANGAPTVAQQSSRQAAAVARTIDEKSGVRLVVLIVVDQMRPDYLTRFGSQLNGGLARLRDAGAFFPNAIQDHAFTETAPGHAALLSGREPVHTNIVTNNDGVADTSAHLIGTNGPGASPRRFRGTTLVDWLRAADSDTRVVSVSRKDRAAILPIGRARANVFWFANGRFTTSNYYADALPPWANDWNARVDLDKLAEKPWTPMLPASQYVETDSVPFENGGRDVVFPHWMKTQNADARKSVEELPVMDSLTLDFALRAVRNTHLGERAHPDILSVSLSTTDAVGHAFGPDSREIHDQILHVDQWLGVFLDSLANVTPSSQTIYVVTADHGVMSLPELLPAPAGRVDLDDAVSAAEAHIESTLHRRVKIRFDNGLFVADTKGLGEARVNLEELSQTLATAAKHYTGVLTAYTPGSLKAAPLTDTVATRLRRSIPEDFGWLAVAVAQPRYIFSKSKKAEHGTMNGDDVGIPIVIAGPGVEPQRITRRVRSVDIAPTLARMLGVEPAEPLDGVPVGEVMQTTAAATANR